MIVQIHAQNDEISFHDTISFTGQVSGFGHYNDAGINKYLTGSRYIPELSYNAFMKNSSVLSFESSVNIWGSASFVENSKAEYQGDIHAHRLWGRMSGKNSELRAGLQKINFGSALMLRPLMWFDSMDPRDPLQLTSGVWSILGRYYFKNNANIWLWTLYGNSTSRGLDYFKTAERMPEAGGRIQIPLLKGEAGLSGHFRKINSDGFSISERSDEWRIGIDGKWDVGPGIWFETSFVQSPQISGIFRNKTMAVVGTDYTFGLGNGLLTTFEHLFLSLDENHITFSNTSMFSALSLSYPLSFYDNLSLISYFDYKSNSLYNFLNWKHQFKNLYLYLIAYLNPETNALPLQNSSGAVPFGGKGVLLMLVYHHASK